MAVQADTGENEATRLSVCWLEHGQIRQNADAIGQDCIGLQIIVDKITFSHNRFELMKRDRFESYQRMKFFEHWGFLVSVIVSILVIQLFAFFVNLNGALWIRFFFASFCFNAFWRCLDCFRKNFLFTELDVSLYFWNQVCALNV